MCSDWLLSLYSSFYSNIYIVLYIIIIFIHFRNNLTFKPKQKSHEKRPKKLRRIFTLFADLREFRQTVISQGLRKNPPTTDPRTLTRDFTGIYCTAFTAWAKNAIIQE